MGEEKNRSTDEKRQTRVCALRLEETFWLVEAFL